MFRLLLRALWWRRGLSLATLLVAAITIGAGSLGPLYAHAADESVLRDHLSQSAVESALHLTYDTTAQDSDSLAVVAAQGPKPGSIRGYPTVSSADVVDTTAAGPPQTDPDSHLTTQLVYRAGYCEHLAMTRGRCPTAAGEVVVSERTLADPDYGWKIGMTITLDDVQLASTTPGTQAPAPARLTIVGAYRQRLTDDPFWQDRHYFDAHPNGDKADTIDDVFVDQAELALLTPGVTVEVQVDYPIDPRQVTLADVPALRSAVNGLLDSQTATFGTDAVTTDISDVLAAARAEAKTVDLSTRLVSLQLAVLAWLVLFQVIADAVEAKGSEIALAKLRGLSPRDTVRFGLAEPMALVVLGTPLGLLLGWLVVRAFAISVLAPGTPVSLTPGTFGAVAVALAGSVVAAAAAGRRTLRRSVLEQWRRTPGHHPSRLLLVVDVLLAAAAIAGLVLLRRNSADHNPHAATLLAPALLVFAVALLGIRLLPLVLRPLLPATRGTRRIGLFLAARQVVRRPAGLRLAALLAVAVGLATFAIAGESVADHNRTARARVEIGAPVVAPVQFEPSHDPIAATHTADPDGRWAMATAQWIPDGGGTVTGTVLAVDTARLTSVAYSGSTPLTTTEMARSLVPVSVPPPVQLTTTSVRVSITASALSGSHRPTVLLNLRQPGKPLITVAAGTLAPGSHDYTASVPCAAGCTLTGLTWDRPIDTFDELSGTVLVSRIATSTSGTYATLQADLTDPSGWARGPSAGNSTDRLSTSAAGLRDSWTSESGGSAGIAHADSPRPVPVLGTPRGLTTGNATGVPQMSDDTSAIATLVVAKTVSTLPSVLDDGVMVDLASLRTQLPAFDAEATWSIWLGPDAPSDAVARLRAAGLTLDVGATESGRITELGREGPALALRLLLVCAIAGAVLAVGGTAVAISATGRRRSFELASLRAIGIKYSTLLRSSVVEQLLLLGGALVLGVPAGYAAARLSMSAIPEFADPTPVTLHYAPSIVIVVEFALVFTVLLVLTAVVAGRSLLASAAPSRLREAE